MQIKAIEFDWIKTLLKTATYGVAGTVSTAAVQLIQGGMDLKQVAIYGVAIGVIAGMKNIAKHYFEVDLDFTKLKK